MQWITKIEQPSSLDEEKVAGWDDNLERRIACVAIAVISVAAFYLMATAVQLRQALEAVA